MRAVCFGPVSEHAPSDLVHKVVLEVAEMDGLAEVLGDKEKTKEVVLEVVARLQKE